MTLTVLALPVVVLVVASSDDAFFARARVTRLGGESDMSAVFLRFCVAGMDDLIDCLKRRPALGGFYFALFCVSLFPRTVYSGCVGTMFT